MSTDRARAHSLIDELTAAPDAAADRAVAVLHAHAASLAWVRQTLSGSPAPTEVAVRLDAAAELLRTGADDRDPVAALGQTAVEALAEHRATTAA
ncbi:MAG: hypothetical protein ACRDT6_06770 [Micromonosporaceae bacterium]